MLKIAIICGGPTLERGISLNSARSLLDHLPSDLFEIVPVYVDRDKNFYTLSPSQLYSNTPEDFDFKLSSIAKKEELSEILQRVDLAFPAIHGPFGDDGELQSLLERHKIPFVGSESKSCRKVFLKHLANRELERLNFPVLPYSVVTPETNIPQIDQRTIVKPSSGGSSIGVYSVDNHKAAKEKIETLFSLFEDKHVILEPFCEGKEFTIVVIESPTHGTIALTPTEIETSYEDHQIFDYRKKYLPTHQTFYHTPPRFDPKTIQNIKTQAVELFQKLEMRDFARMDGWVMEDGTIYFSDFNPISGMEQNSFLFRQAAAAGFTHEEILLSIVNNACKRASIPFPKKNRPTTDPKKKVFVLFGGKTAERQVSLMSGTNVWLKLLKSDTFEPIPYFLDPNDSVWKLPYSFALNHTVEEVFENCKKHPFSHCLSLSMFISLAKEEGAFVFIALHGGMGENGELQKRLEEAKVPFNGSSSNSSSLCMDKALTGEMIHQAGRSDILSLPKKIFCFSEIDSRFWEETVNELKTEKLIIKPKDDGCSAGIVLLQSKNDFLAYSRFIFQKASSIPPGTFLGQENPIEMPTHPEREFLLEPFIETDFIYFRQNEIVLQEKTGWIELTVGVMEENGEYQSLNPSITIAKGRVLTLEEKFQGGTGINITPPPESILSQAAIEKIKHLVEETAFILKIGNYARIDLFFNRKTEKMIVIEANTLPGLTPSTVLYHQALAENPPIPPRKFLERIIDSALSRVSVV